MKRGILGIMCVIIVFFLFCDKNNPTEATVTFVLVDLTGDWSGDAENSNATVNLELTVEASGNVTGSGVRSTWSVSESGNVSGGGSFSFISGSSLTVASAGWNLEMSSDKKTLTGTFNVAHPSLHDMSVNLTKQ